MAHREQGHRQGHREEGHEEGHLRHQHKGHRRRQRQLQGREQDRCLQGRREVARPPYAAREWRLRGRASGVRPLLTSCEGPDATPRGYTSSSPRAALVSLAFASDHTRARVLPVPVTFPVASSFFSVRYMRSPRLPSPPNWGARTCEICLRVRDPCSSKERMASESPALRTDLLTSGFLPFEGATRTRPAGDSWTRP